MSRPFFMPQEYQNMANALPGMAARAPVAYAGGQNQHIVGPEQALAQDIHGMYSTTAGRGSWGGYFVPGAAPNPIEGMVDAYSMGTKAMPGDVARSQMLSLGGGLGRVSGVLPSMREVRRSPSVRGGSLGSFVNPRAFGSGSSGTLGVGATVYANVRDLSGTRGFRGLGSTMPWYENPWYLGGGAVAIIGAVWFLTRKKRR